MRINGNAARPGMVIEHQGSIWRVVRAQAVQPGKGGAYNQVELRNLENGTKLNERFRASENLERLYVEGREFQYLYGDGDTLTLMDTSTYEQIDLPAPMVGESAPFLQDGMNVTVEYAGERAIAVRLPDTAVQTVTETEAVVKGQTSASSFKPATLDNGVRTMVPPHVESGTRVVVNTLDGSYVERAKD